MGKTTLYGQEAKDAKGHGSEKRGAKKSVYAPDSHEEPSVLRSETPQQRAARIRAKKIDPARAKVIRKALGMREVRIRESAGIIGHYQMSDEQRPAESPMGGMTCREVVRAFMPKTIEGLVWKKAALSRLREEKGNR